MKKLLEPLRNVLAIIAFNIIWIILIILFYKWLYNSTAILNVIPSHGLFGGFIMDQLDYGETARSMFFIACISAPVWEEAAFRYAPLTLAKDLLPQNKALPVAVILSSIVFGWGHGGPLNIWVQGVFGLGQCWLFLKNKKYGYASCVFTHCFWNAFLMYGLPF